jgi:hypothetical protein
MTETEANVRESLLKTLSFLASEPQQREFAERVSYASYQGEFACWWFDTFFPDEPSALHMFTAPQLTILKSFSEVFERNFEALGNAELPLVELHHRPEWRAIVCAAREASAKLAGAT